jgi:hypothetical protein
MITCIFVLNLIIIIIIIPFSFYKSNHRPIGLDIKYVTCKSLLYATRHEIKHIYKTGLLVTTVVVLLLHGLAILCHICMNKQNKQKQTPWPLVRERTIPTQLN